MAPGSSLPKGPGSSVENENSGLDTREAENLSQEQKEQMEKEKSRKERLRLSVEMEVDRLQKEIIEKPEGDKLHYKEIAEIRNTGAMPGYKWIDFSNGAEIPNEKIVDWLMQKEVVVSSEHDENIKKFTEKISKQKEEDKVKTIEEYADDSKTSIFDIQSNQQYEKMSGAFTKGEFVKGKALEIDLKGNAKFELYIGLGHIFPPSVQKVKVIDNKGGVRIGSRDIKDKVGYFDNQGYTPVFSGYKVEILETISEEGDLYKELLKKESDFYKGQKEIAQNGAWKEETVDQMLKEGKDENSEYVADFKNTEKILLDKRIRINAQSLMTDAQILRSLKGKASEKLGGWDSEKNEIKDPENKTLKLLERFSQGGSFGQFTLIQGYEFKLGDLERIEKYANNEQLMMKDFEKAFASKGGLPMSFEEVTKELILGEGAMNLNEVRNHPQFRRRMAENGMPFVTPDDYINMFRNRPGVSPSRMMINPNIYRDGKILGDLMCARYVSDVLGIKPPDYSAPSLFTRVVKGGGKIIPEVQNVKKGDLIFFRGTYGDKWNTISHVGYVVDAGNGYVTMRHNGGPVNGVQTKTIKLDSAYSKKFYAGVRIAS
ncbi:MAG: hypothetical protein US89_C0005G0085 [Candidatus Peregrinibacteria bacterium GW2011_GWF2_38_29]|nr:MAG: hypothetical protein US89_C0005G0085 [Candidatus Peregrinibacteria bacterium GW2011_GWF2_38_29]HBB02672.1 hypothetical protein [Candidatus Peregrinibacteria bacterium]